MSREHGSRIPGFSPLEEAGTFERFGGAKLGCGA